MISANDPFFGAFDGCAAAGELVCCGSLAGNELPGLLLLVEALGRGAPAGELRLVNEDVLVMGVLEAATLGLALGSDDPFVLGVVR